jgi:hypothetical protein
MLEFRGIPLLWERQGINAGCTYLNESVPLIKSNVAELYAARYFLILF